MKTMKMHMGVPAGILFFLWKVISFNPWIYPNLGILLQLPFQITVRYLGPCIAAVFLVLGLITDSRNTARAGCFLMAGVDLYLLSNYWKMLPYLGGGGGLAAASYLAEAVCFLILFFLLGRREGIRAPVLTAAFLGFASQTAFGADHINLGLFDNFEMPSAVLLLLAIVFTGFYCAGTDPGQVSALYKNAGRGRALSQDPIDQETVWRASSGDSGDKKERLRRLKELQRGNVITQQEYEELAERIRRS